MALNNNRMLANCLVCAGRFDEAAEQSRKTLDLEPRYDLARFHLAMALWSSGHGAEAISVPEAGRTDARGDRLTEACLGVAYAKVSRDEEARSIIEALARRREDGYLSAFPLAMVHMALGDTDEAIEWLEQMYRDRDPMGHLPCRRTDGATGSRRGILRRPAVGRSPPPHRGGREGVAAAAPASKPSSVA